MLFLAPFIEFEETICNYSQNSYTVDDVSQDTTTNDILLDITDEICNIPQINLTLQCEAIHKNPEKPKNKPTTSNLDETILNIVTRPEDPDEQFMLSSVPILKKLTLRKNMIARMRIQNVGGVAIIRCTNKFRPFYKRWPYQKGIVATARDSAGDV
ncbi:hypothetical protein ABEB36_014626 [Hypothenemus hampei]|uniref:BESS domain-containing protein n=1 Tax=Hypothenemus hampei TaxID=57062 RepID=A0ABD1E701_HYPHA